MRKVLKIAGYFIGSLVALLLLIMFIIQTKWAKNFIRKQAVNYLQNKIGTEVSIQNLDYNIPDRIIIEGVFLRDQQGDTLLWVNKFSADIDMIGLISGKVAVDQLTLDGVNAHVYRSLPDTVFNYNYIVEAFASKDKPAEVDTTKGASPDLKVGFVTLRNISLRYDDTTGGVQLNTFIGKLLLKPEKLDLESMTFDIRDFNLYGTQISFIADTSYLPATGKVEQTPSPLLLAVKHLQLKDIDLKFYNKVDSVYASVNLGALNSRIDRFSLQDQWASVDYLDVSQLNAILTTGRRARKVEEVAAEAADSIVAQGWRFSLGKLSLTEIAAKIDDNNISRTPERLDFAHIEVPLLSMKLNDFVYSTDTISGALKQFYIYERGGFTVNRLETDFRYTTNGVLLDNLLLQTPNSILKNHVLISYPSLSAIQSESAKVGVEVLLDKSRVGIDDLFYFMNRAVQNKLKLYKGQYIDLTTDIKGSLASLELNKLNIRALKGTVLDLHGSVKGLPDANRIIYAFDRLNFKTLASDIKPFLTDSIRRQLRIPDWLVISGKIKGSVKSYYPDLHLRTSDGDARVAGFLDMNRIHQERYEIVVSTSSLNVGKIIRNDSMLGEITLRAAAKGRSFDFKRMNADFQVFVTAAEAMAYNYHSLEFSGQVNGGKAQLSGRSNDPNLNFLLDSRADLNGRYPAITGSLDIRNINPFALNLYKDTLTFKGYISTDIKHLNPDYPDGSFYWIDPVITMPSRVIHMDSVAIVSKPITDSTQDIAFNLSNILQGSLKGTLPLTQTGNFINALTKRYYNGSDTTRPDENQHLILEARASYHPIFERLLPQLKPFDSIGIYAGLAIDTSRVDVFSPGVNYIGTLLDSIYISALGGNDNLSFHAGARQIVQGNITLWEPQVSGDAGNDSLRVTINLKDSASRDQMRIGAHMSTGNSDTSESTVIRLNEGLLLHYEPWTVNPANRLVFEKNGFYLENLTINKASESLSAHSRQPLAGSPMDIRITNFSLGNILRMVSGDTLLADGTINANALVDLSDSIPGLEGTVSVTDLQAFNHPVGNLTVEADNKGKDTYNAEIRLSGQGNDVLLGGSYFTVPLDGNLLDFKLAVNQLNLKSLEGLTFGAISNSSGSITGNLDIKGSPSKPILDGALKTNQLRTTVSMLGTPLTMPQESIIFRQDGVRFQNFTIVDKNQNNATIDGSVLTGDFRTFDLDLHLNADQWQPIDSKKEDNELFYGKLILSTGLDITGSSSAPHIDGNITIHDSTDFTYARVDNGPGIVESEGIVRFRDGRDTAVVDTTQFASVATAQAAAMQMNVNVGIEKNAIFNVVVDPATGDNLQVRGEASLNAAMSPDGSVGLTGNYELLGGHYDLHYNFLRRKFNIKPGSIVTLAGDPLDADVDITAIYDANIAPFELVEQQVDPAELNYFKQRLPFQVLLKLKGKAMKPEITFDILLPEDAQTGVTSNVADQVRQKLTEIRSDASSMNKQVFAVLILGRFIEDDPFASGSGGGMEYAARQSASRFLSDQLNKLADNLVQGIELNVGLESTEDYSSGAKQNRTDLNIAASKRLLNDRLKITVGNDFQLEGGQTQSQQSSVIPGNLSADYQLSKDGRYVMRAYRTNEMQNMVDGFVIETGLSLRLSLEYNRFRHLFRKRIQEPEKLQPATNNDKRPSARGTKQ